MDFGHPLMVVTPTLDGDVLAALARADAEFSGRELARHVGYGSTEGIRRAADRLVAQGVVSRRAAGAAHLYRLILNRILGERSSRSSSAWLQPGLGMTPVCWSSARVRCPAQRQGRY